MNRERDKKEYRMKVSKRFIFITMWAYVFSFFAFPGDLCAGRFVQTHLVKTAGDISAAEVPILAKYDIVNLKKMHYSQGNGDLWRELKAINPNIEIYTYSQINQCRNCDDDKAVIYLNNLGRYNVSRGHSMGSLNGHHPNWFLTDSAGQRLYGDSVPSENKYIYLLDFGDKGFQSYSIEAIKTDYIGKPWLADGIYSDICTSIKTSKYNTPIKYDTDVKWSTAMNSMIEAMTNALHDDNIKFACNRGKSRTESGYNAWLSLDSSLNPPDAVLEEGAFAAGWGAGYETQFFTESRWKRQVDILRLVQNSKILFISHTALSPGETGQDNYGRPVTYWQTFWYALGSYLLGKNDKLNNAYFMFGTHPYDTIPWFDEYDQIDLGKAIAEYKVTNYNGRNIYWREFEKGYVYVNPTKYDVSSISLAKTCKQLTHDNFKNDPTTISSTGTINLKGNHAAILLKNTYDDVPIIPSPLNLRIERVE